jgi:hypothetical protein
MDAKLVFLWQDGTAVRESTRATTEAGQGREKEHAGQGARVHARRKVARLTTKWATRLQVAAKVTKTMPLTLVKLAPEPKKSIFPTAR